MKSLVSAFVALLFASSSLCEKTSVDQKDLPNEFLISVGPEAPPVWLNEEQKMFLMKIGAGFMDITETPNLHEGDVPKVKMAFPSFPVRQREVSKYIDQIQLENLRSDLTELSQDYFTRYYLTSTGVSSANWLYRKALEYSNNRTDITVTQFKHARFNQQSVIARMEGRQREPMVIIGAHLDSINVNNPSNGRSPGADDDGTGTVTVLEVFRNLAEGGFVPEYPIEFQLYAGEEAGLLGSQEIAQFYKNQGKAVYGMFQLDMTGYTDGKSSVKVLNDFVNKELTAFSKLVIKEYTSLNYRDHNCGYGCSDHASWYRAGYPSSTTFEPITNPRIHTTDDDLDLINWNQVFEFIKLTIGMAVELSYGSN